MPDNEISKSFANLLILIYVPYCVFNFYFLVQKLLQIPNPKKTLHNLQQLLGASASIEALGIKWFHWS